MITNLRCGWLSPEGKIEYTSHYEHFDKARTILLKYYPDEYDMYHPDTALLNLGWVGITVSEIGEKTWMLYWTKHLTQEQIRFLQDYKYDIFPMNLVSKMNLEYEEDRVS